MFGVVGAELRRNKKSKEKERRRAEIKRKRAKAEALDKVSLLFMEIGHRHHS